MNQCPYHLPPAGRPACPVKDCHKWTAPETCNIYFEYKALSADEKGSQKKHFQANTSQDNK